MASTAGLTGSAAPARVTGAGPGQRQRPGRNPLHRPRREGGGTSIRAWTVGRRSQFWELRVTVKQMEMIPPALGISVLKTAYYFFVSSL